MGEASRDSRATASRPGITPLNGQLGAYAQAAVIFFAVFAIALLFVAAAPIPIAYKSMLQS